MYKCNGESIDHLLLHCPLFQIFGLFGVFRMMPKSVVELLAFKQSHFGHHRNGHIWTIIPYCLIWCILRKMNSRSFEHTKHSMSNLRLFFFRTLLDWIIAFRNLSFFSIVDLLDLCNFRYIHFYYLLKKKKKTCHLQ